MPKLASFQQIDDLDTNIESLETQLKLYEVPTKFWVSHLVPLLDHNSIWFQDGMPPDKKNDFEYVKKELLKHHGHGRGHYRQKWDTLTHKAGESHHQLGQAVKKIEMAWAK